MRIDCLSARGVNGELMMTRELNRLLPRIAVTAAIVSGVACTNRLKDYTQVTMQASPLENGAAIGPDVLEATKTVLETRLSGLGVDAAEVKAVEPDQLVVKLPEIVNAQAAEAILISTGQLYLRNQKPDTAAELAENIEELQRLLVEQNTLAQTGESAAATLQEDINTVRSAIAALFEPTDLTGEMLYDAKIQPAETGSDIWDVRIQFDEQGADMFAEQTKLMAGTGRSIGLFLDDVLLAAPVVDEEYEKNGITVGTAVISGNFTQSAAKDLQVQLQSGALPVALETTEFCRYSEGEGACWRGIEASGL